MMNSSINLHQLTMIKKIMNHHFGYSVFASLKKVSDLGRDHVEPTFGMYEYITVEGEKPEEIPFWAKNPTEVFIK